MLATRKLFPKVDEMPHHAPSPTYKAAETKMVKRSQPYKSHAPDPSFNFGDSVLPNRRSEKSNLALAQASPPNFPEDTKKQATSFQSPHAMRQGRSLYLRSSSVIYDASAALAET